MKTGLFAVSNRLRPAVACDCLSRHMPTVTGSRKRSLFRVERRSRSEGLTGSHQLRPSAATNRSMLAPPRYVHQSHFLTPMDLAGDLMAMQFVMLLDTVLPVALAQFGYVFPAPRT